MEDLDIKTLGRWRSLAYLDYIRMPSLECCATCVEVEGRVKGMVGVLGPGGGSVGATPLGHDVEGENPTPSHHLVPC